jgi:flagellar hook capping protein FlgD
VAAYTGGATHLHWLPNGESDLWYYAIYRGSSASFTPGPANQIATPADTGYSDVGPAGSYDKLSAYDVNGNQSGFALVTPGGTVEVGGVAPPRELFLAARPNPARGAAKLRFGLPRDATVSLVIYDAGGREVRSLAAGRFPAGEHALTWNLCDAAERPVGRGVYFVRLRAEGAVRTGRIAVVE